MKLTKSKQAIAEAIHASGKGWPDGVKWACQPRGGIGSVYFCDGEQAPYIKGDYFTTGKGGRWLSHVAIHHKLPQDCHQTVLSREEYFSAYPVVDAPPPETINCKCASVAPKPTIEQLAADYRNKLDFANRKQQETDNAMAAADAALGELVKAGEALGLVIGTAKPKLEPVIAGRPDLKVGDKCVVVESPDDRDLEGRELELMEIDDDDLRLPYLVKSPRGEWWVSRIRRP